MNNGCSNQSDILDAFAIGGSSGGTFGGNLVSVPKILVRNINYFVIFKINDNVSLNNIIQNHNIADVDSSIIKAAYSVCTQTFGNFFMIDMKKTNLDERFRMNFLNFLDLKNPQLL